MVKAIDKTLQIPGSIRCGIHSAQRTVVNSIAAVPELKRAISNLKKAISTFSKSHVATGLLHEKQKEMHQPRKKLQSMPDTRWNYLVTAAEVAISQWPVLRELYSDDDMRTGKERVFSDKKRLKQTSVSVLKECVAILKPFQEFTLAIEGEDPGNIGKTLPFLWALKRKMRATVGVPIVVGGQVNMVPEANLGEAARQLRRALREDLKSRFPDGDINPTLATATALHPTFKNLAAQGLSDAQTRRVWEGIRLKVDQAITDLKRADLYPADMGGLKRPAEETVEENGGSLLDDIMSRTIPAPSPVDVAVGGNAQALAPMAVDARLRNRDEVIEEISRYSLMLVQKVSVADWWKQFGSQFPGLARVAMSVFVVPATSANVERFFSRPEGGIRRLVPAHTPERTVSGGAHVPSSQLGAGALPCQLPRPPERRGGEEGGGS
jgi:hypothetical protein